MTAITKKNVWGLALFLVISVFAIVRSLLEPFSGHFRVFTSAAERLWANQVAYGTDFGTGVGYWFYSPTCGLSFGVFSLFPEKLGLVIFLLLSLLVFIWGTLRLAEVFQASSGQTASFFLLVSPQVYSAILASKLELMMVGILFLSISLWLQRRIVLSAALLAMILNWKFQPLPVLGLFFSYVVLFERDWKFVAFFLGATIFWWALPLVFLSYDGLLQNHLLWSSSLSAFVQEAYLSFDNIYKSMHQLFGWKLSYSDSVAMALLFGALFLGVQLRHSFGRRGEQSADRLANRKEFLLCALSLGSVFICVFSPLNQNNAYIWFAPVFWVLLELGRRQGWQNWLFAISGSFAIVGLSYSDLVPKVFSESFRMLALKPLWVFGIGVVLSVYLVSASFRLKRNASLLKEGIG